MDRPALKACADCYDECVGHRCERCKAKRREAKNRGVNHCSYCQQPGHIKRVCPAHKRDLARIAQIDAWLESNAKLLADEAAARKAHDAATSLRDILRRTQKP